MVHGAGFACVCEVINAGVVFDDSVLCVVRVHGFLTPCVVCSLVYLKELSPLSYIWGIM